MTLHMGVALQVLSELQGEVKVHPKPRQLDPDSYNLGYREALEEYGERLQERLWEMGVDPEEEE